MQEIQVWSLGQQNSPGEGNGNSLQYSCLENPMDRKPGGLQSAGSQSVAHDYTCMHTVIKAKPLKSTQMSWGWYMCLPLLLQSPGVPWDFRIEWHLGLRGCSVACLPVTHFKRSGSHSEPQKLWEMWSLPPSISPCLGCTSNMKYSCPPYL